MPRLRHLLPFVLVTMILAATLVAGCSSQDNGSTGSDTTATTAPASGGGSGWTTVDVQTAHDALSADDAAQIVDVREPSEWADTGVPEGAVLIPLGDLEAQAAGGLSKDAPVYVICRSGNRSQTGSDILAGMGFTEVYNVDGGMNAWVAAGLPVEAYQQ
jgi:rhodanese-related sulfurtransferase